MVVVADERVRREDIGPAERGRGSALYRAEEVMVVKVRGRGREPSVGPRLIDALGMISVRFIPPATST